MLENTTQHTTHHDHPLLLNVMTYQGLIPLAQLQLLMETVAMDTYFAKTCALGGATCAQVFYGVHSHMINIYGMKSERKMPEAYKDFIQDEGIPCILCHDNSQIHKGVQTTKINWEHFMKDQFMEPNHPQQNPAELLSVKFLEDHSQVLLDWTGAPETCWLMACEYITNVHSRVCADETLGYQIMCEVQHGGLQDILLFWNTVSTRGSSILILTSPSLPPKKKQDVGLALLPMLGMP